MALYNAMAAIGTLTYYGKNLVLLMFVSLSKFVFVFPPLPSKTNKCKPQLPRDTASNNLGLSPPMRDVGRPFMFIIGFRRHQPCGVM